MTTRLAIAALTILVLLVFSLSVETVRADEEVIRYVGSVACRDCHEKYYSNFMTYAMKSKSFQSIKRVGATLTDEEIKECYGCHTTGYGRPGGFVSPEETPYLMNAGCEVCHGPGEKHVRTKGQGYIIGKISDKDCVRCHIAERVTSFGLKPLVHGGAH